MRERCGVEGLGLRERVPYEGMQGLGRDVWTSKCLGHDIYSGYWISCLVFSISRITIANFSTTINLW